jgi:hypothetical protein
MITINNAKMKTNSTLREELKDLKTEILFQALLDYSNQILDYSENMFRIDLRMSKKQNEKVSFLKIITINSFIPS